MKACCRCKVEKDLHEFHLRSKSKDGRAYACKQCVKKYDADRYAKLDKARSADISAAWRNNNRAYLTEYMRTWRTNNRDATNRIAKAARKRNRDRVYANNAKRRAQARNATPLWANMFFIREAYKLARLRTDMTGINWEVDHVVPLRNKLVCGLHSHTNIQVIPKAINLKKRHWKWPDMPQGEQS